MDTAREAAMRQPDGSDRPFAPENTGDFRAYVRDWVRQNLTRADPGADRMGLGTDEELLECVARHRKIQARLYGAGLAGIRYPREYGGQGLTEAHQQAFIEETAGYEVPVQLSVTLSILGPTLLDFGTERQKQTHIRGMLRGDEIWVQLLSEPSSGSDMAGALTRAQRDGDVYVVNGSKIWTTGAHVADYGMLLARTDPDLPKHSGLSMIITPLSAPGITISPIRLATGASDFCQEFFDDVLLPVDNLIGKENDGWAVASRLLFHERNMVGGIGLSDTRTHAPPEEGAEYELGFGPGYDWRAVVSRSVPDKEFELEIVSADEDWRGTRVGFFLDENEGVTQVRFHHTGWPESNDHYRVSCYCWPMYLRLLRRQVEHGEVVPYEDRLDV